jgi:glycosyltransferase involved in cell wall biosynthesis
VERNLAEVSVIVPTRNEVRNVPRFLTSLHPAIELVVVDASDDGTGDLVQQLRPQRTQVIRSNASIAGARQIGAQHARGHWLIFTDSDVSFAPGYFQALARANFGSAFFGPKYSTASHARYDWLFTRGQRLCGQVGIPAASGSNMGLHRAAFAQVGGFRLDLPVNEDTDLMLRLRRLGVSVQYVPDLAVFSHDDRRLDRGASRKFLHTLARTTLLWCGLFVPLPKRLLTSDWGYWGRDHARGDRLGDIPSGRQRRFDNRLPSSRAP